MVDLSIVMLARLPEGKPPFSYGFPMKHGDTKPVWCPGNFLQSRIIPVAKCESAIYSFGPTVKNMEFVTFFY